MDDKRYLTAGQVRERFGGISDMSLWRWLRDPALGFPQPIRINRRRLFDEQKIAEFEERKAVEAVGAPGAS